MATNTVHFNDPKAARRAPHKRARPLTPGRAVISVACGVAVLLMVMAIAHVARGQVNKGSHQEEAPLIRPAAKVYSSNGGSRVADLDASLAP